MEIVKIVKEGINLVNEFENVLYYSVDTIENNKGILEVKYALGKEMKIQIQANSNTIKSGNTFLESHAQCIMYFETNKNFKPQTLASSKNECADIVQRKDGSYWLLADIIEDYSHTNNNKTGFMSCQAIQQANKPDGILN